LRNAVATLGTATTPEHVQKLLRQSDEIVFCFDGDGAGRRAAWRALENALAQLQDGKQVRFLFLPEGEDPDTFVRKHGKADFERQLDGARPLSRFLLEELAARVDLATAEGRANMLHAAKPLLKQMQANALRLQLVRELAVKCRSSPEEVAQLCELGQSSASSRTAPAPVRAAARPVASLVEPILSLLVSSPGVSATVSEEQRLLLDSPEMAPVVQLLDLLQESGATTVAMLTEVTRGSEYFPLYQEIAAKTMAEPLDEGMAKVMLADALIQLEKPRVEAEFQRLVAEGQRSDVERERFQTISRRLRELKGASPVGQRPPL
jgi:DNA primase